MGYRIVYNGPRKGKKFALMALFFCMGLLLGICLVPDGRRAVQAALLPGNGEAAWRAGELLDAALRRGEGVLSSALKFCREAASGLG